MVQCKFSKQWRGYPKGALAELTDERAAELIRSGFASPVKAKKEVAGGGKAGDKVARSSGSE